MTEPTARVSATSGARIPIEKKPCDLVMKGGITSGVVYPPAVIELSKSYYFCNIGGASAGAIAAAATAAAQYGEMSAPDGPGSGFTLLLQKSLDLAQPGFLTGLFQPTPSSRPLFAALMAFMKYRHPLDPSTPARRWIASLLHALVGTNPWRSLLGFLGGFLLTLGLLAALATLWIGSVGTTLDQFQSGTALAVVSLLLAISISLVFAALGGLLAAVMPLYKIVRFVLPETFFGMTTGHDQGGESPSTSQPPLTDWLTTSLNELAGRAGEAPVTFGDLRARGIDLRLITTNLTYGQPFELPLESNHSVERPNPSGLFLFDVREMTQLFPTEVVRTLVDAACVDTGYSLDDDILNTHRFLPLGQDQPIVFGARLSLSFPLLLSAIPLYSLKPASYGKTADTGQKLSRNDLVRNWFSDGGISSNFPIHFFDSWLPARPTFGVYLTSAASPEMDVILRRTQDSGEERSPSDFVHLPDPKEFIYPASNQIDGVFGFGHAIWHTAQNYRDSTQAMLPGYRERIVKVALEKGEGGLNLAMSPEKIQRMQDKGTAAGESMAGIDFDVHRWLRFRTISAELERQLTKMRDRYTSEDYPGLLEQVKAEEQAGEERFPYFVDGEWCDEATERLDELTSVWEGMDTSFLTEDAPKPSPVLRATPPG
jgi:hypothetical protein